MNASKVAEKRLVAKVLSLQDIAVPGHKFSGFDLQGTHLWEKMGYRKYMVAFAEACLGYY